MFGLLKKDVSGAGSVYFRGNIPPRAEEFGYLRQQGVEVTRLPDGPGAHWGLKLRHKDWGEADALCLRDMPPMPEFMIDMATSLTDDEKKEAKSGGPGVTVKAPARKKNVLRDRKNLLRFLRAIMADDGVVVADHNSQLLWSRTMLDEELEHDADLDVQSITCFHAIISDEPVGEDEEPRTTWLHSHGLAELGAFDFDVMHPSADVRSDSGTDILRAVSFAIIEGELKPEMSRLVLGKPGPVVRTVPGPTFQKTAAPDVAAIRDDAEPTHDKNRSVLCEPEGGGLMGLFRGKRPRPSRFFSSALPEPMMVNFSTAASELMAERARGTVGVFRRLMEEFGKHELPTIVKLGIPVDHGDGREHMWFEVHHVGGSDVDCTLMNQPFHVSKMKKGDRSRQPLAMLTDWSIMTPFGAINPRSQASARFIREHPELLAMMKMMGG